MADPVAQDHQPRMAGQLDVQLDVPVAEDEIVDIGMLLDILAGKEHQMLLVLTEEDGIVLLLVTDVAVTGPCQSEADTPAGMQVGEEPLAYTVVST